MLHFIPMEENYPWRKQALLEILPVVNGGLGSASSQQHVVPGLRSLSWN